MDGEFSGFSMVELTTLVAVVVIATMVAKITIAAMVKDGEGDGNMKGEVKYY